MKSVWNKWLITGVLAIVGFLAFFRQEMGHGLADLASSGISGIDPLSRMQDADLELVTAARFELERDNSRYLNLTEMHIEQASDQNVRVTFRLVSRIGGNDYPNLRVSLIGAGGEVRRVVQYSPSEYEHGAKLSDERIAFDVDRRPGEAHLTAEVYYPSTKGGVD